MFSRMSIDAPDPRTRDDRVFEPHGADRSEQIGSTSGRVAVAVPVGNYTTRQQEQDELAVRPGQVAQR
jgi:hypothetical protein